MLGTSRVCGLDFAGCSCAGCSSCRGVSLHLGIRLAMGLDYSAQALTVLVVFVNWPLAVEWLRHKPEAPSPSRPRPARA